MLVTNRTVVLYPSGRPEAVLKALVEDEYLQSQGIPLQIIHTCRDHCTHHWQGSPLHIPSVKKRENVQAELQVAAAQILQGDIPLNAAYVAKNTSRVTVNR